MDKHSEGSYHGFIRCYKDKSLKGEFFFFNFSFKFIGQRGIKAYKNFKTYKKTTNKKYFDGVGHHRPILQGDKGFLAQPTYNGLWQAKANSFKGLEAQEKWSCPALLYVNDFGKAKSYKFYTMNSL